MIQSVHCKLECCSNKDTKEATGPPLATMAEGGLFDVLGVVDVTTLAANLAAALTGFITSQ